MRPPGNYDALRQAEQQAKEARDAPSQPEAAAQPDSAQKEPMRPTNHPGTSARTKDNGEPALQVETRFDAVEIAKAAKERADAIAQTKEKDDRER